MEAPLDIVRLHSEIVAYASVVQEASTRKKTIENHIEESVYTVFSKVDAFGVTLHRAVITLCGGGWTHVAPLLLRPMMECSANCLAMIHNEFPEFMAFKYLYFPYIEVIRDEDFPDVVRQNIIKDLEAGLKQIKDPRILEKAKGFIATPTLPYYWFKPEENNISSILKKYGGEEMLFVYGALSTAVHGYHIGMGLFKDDSDIVSIDPIDNPRKTQEAIAFSCRHLLELLSIRNIYEGLGLEPEHEVLLAKLFSLKK